MVSSSCAHLDASRTTLYDLVSTTNYLNICLCGLICNGFYYLDRSLLIQCLDSFIRPWSVSICTTPLDHLRPQFVLDKHMKYLWLHTTLDRYSLCECT